MKKAKFKLRFSYFLIAGIIGYILQIVAFFLWKNFDDTISEITSSSTSAYYNGFILPVILGVIGMAFSIVMIVGFLMASKKEQFFLRLGSVVGLAGEGVACIASVVYLIFTKIVRTKMYTESGYSNTINVLVSVKNVGLMIAAIALTLIYLGVLLHTKKTGIGKAGTWIAIVSNGFLFVMLFGLIVSSLWNNAYNLIAKYLMVTTSLSSFADSTSTVWNYGSMNGFTFSQLRRLFMLGGEINTNSQGVDYSKLMTSNVFAIITIISYAVSAVGNFLASSFLMVESFDVDKDEHPMVI